MDGLRAAGLQGSASRARGRESFIASLAYAWGGPQAGPAGSGQSVALTTAQWFVRQGHLDETRIQSRAQTLLPEVLAVPDAERALDLVADATMRHVDVEFHLVPSDEAAPAIRDARIIVCATTATSALFDAADAREDVAAVAVGTHSPTCCELPSELVGRSFVVVEERESALREAGDVVCAITAGLMTPDDIAADLTQIARKSVEVPAGGSRVFKSMGMAWEDAVVSARIAEGVA